MDARPQISVMLTYSANFRSADLIVKKMNELRKNDSLKNKMYLTNKKAEKYKKQHEEDINYINSLSDNDIAKLFADKFND